VEHGVEGVGGGATISLIGIFDGVVAISKAVTTVSHHSSKRIYASDICLFVRLLVRSFIVSFVVSSVNSVTLNVSQVTLILPVYICAHRCFLSRSLSTVLFNRHAWILRPRGIRAHVLDLYPSRNGNYTTDKTCPLSSSAFTCIAGVEPSPLAHVLALALDRRTPLCPRISAYLNLLRCREATRNAPPARPSLHYVGSALTSWYDRRGSPDKLAAPTTRHKIRDLACPRYAYRPPRTHCLSS